MSDVDQLLTLDQLLGTAEAAGHGSRAALRAKFLNWQKRGLLGKAVTKTSRRGGEGLWHPAQRELWLALLRHRQTGVRLAALSNLPVGGWMLGIPGIETSQARRALAFWAQREPPRGRRTLQRTAVTGQVETLAAPGADAASKRRLRSLFEDLNSARTVISSDALADHLRPVLAPGQGPLSTSQRREIEAASQHFRLQFLALEHFSVLVQDRPEVDEFWAWARKFIAITLPAYMAAQPKLRADPDVGYLYGSPDLNAFFGASCATLLLVFGIALSEPSPAVIERCGVPPPLPESRKKSPRRGAPRSSKEHP